MAGCGVGMAPVAQDLPGRGPGTRRRRQCPGALHRRAEWPGPGVRSGTRDRLGVARCGSWTHAHRRAAARVSCRDDPGQDDRHGAGPLRAAVGARAVSRPPRQMERPIWSPAFHGRASCPLEFKCVPGTQRAACQARLPPSVTVPFRPAIPARPPSVSAREPSWPRAA